MKVRFITNEHKHDSLEPNLWMIREPFVGEVTCDEWPDPILIVVPGGYKTDFESVPGILVLAYMLIKGKARRAATLHDYLCDYINNALPVEQQTNLIPFMPTRQWVDKVFYAAMVAEGTSAIARELAYAGVTAYTAIRGK